MAFDLYVTEQSCRQVRNETPFPGLADGPTTSLYFLGILVDTEKMEYRKRRGKTVRCQCDNAAVNGPRPSRAPEVIGVGCACSENG
jgi:hypothetical protein